MTRVAVVIVNYNAGPLLRKCLEALARQTFAPSRVLVMDNGSIDGSIDECRGLFPWAEFHLLGANTGFAHANNRAVELSSDCEWVALINPDAFAEPSWLETFVRWAAAFPHAASFASCMLRASDPRMLDGAGDVYRADGLAWPRNQGGPAAELPGEPDEVFAACAGAAFYRRAAFIEAGGFCERYFCYYEDVDLGFRLRLLGHQCKFIPEAVVHHEGSALAGKGSEFSVYHVHRNFVWTFFRNMPGSLLWRYLPAHLAANLASIFVFVRKGQGRVILRAKWHALRGLPRTLRERRLIQTQRTATPVDIRGALRPGSLFNSAWRSLRRRLDPNNPNARGDRSLKA